MHRDRDPNPFASLFLFFRAASFALIFTILLKVGSLLLLSVFSPGAFPEEEDLSPPVFLGILTSLALIAHYISLPVKINPLFDPPPSDPDPPDPEP